MSGIFNALLYQPLLNILIFLTNLFQGSFGFAILAMTFIIKIVTIPLSLPAMRSTSKIRDLKPKLDELKKRYGKDKRRLQQEQLNLYREEGVNPAAGCLPTIIQFAVLIALYRVFIDFINNGNGNIPLLNMNFFWLDLSKPDQFYVLPVLTGLTQLLFSKMLMPGTEHHQFKDLKAASQIKEKKLHGQTKNQDTEQDMAEAVQQQMMYIMPFMTTLIALRLPSGLAVYWVATTVFSIIQQYFTSGLGGLAPLVKKYK